ATGHAEVLLDLFQAEKGEEARRKQVSALALAVEDVLEEGHVLAAAELVAGVRRAIESAVPEAARATARTYGPGSPLRAFLASVATQANGARVGEFLS